MQLNGVPMVLEGLLNVARSGMTTQTRAFERSAQVIANPEAYPQEDMTRSLLDTQMAARNFKANAIVYETGVDFWEMLGMIKKGDE